MDNCLEEDLKIRESIPSDVHTLYGLLEEYVQERNLGAHFTNSLECFEQHFKDGFVRAFVAESCNGIVGCVFYSYTYDYVIGKTMVLHCLSIKPAFRSSDLERNMLQRAKRVSAEADIDVMLMMLKRGDLSKQTLEMEGVINLTNSPEYSIEMCVIPNTQTMVNEVDMQTYRIREGSSEDLADVYKLLEELIELEEIGDDFTVTKEAFIRDGTAEEALFGCLIAEHIPSSPDQEPYRGVAGCIIYSKMCSPLMGRTYFLHGLYVRKHHRGQGLAKALLRRTMKVCESQGGDGFLVMIMRENAPSQALFRSHQAVNLSQSHHDMEWLTVKHLMNDYKIGGLNTTSKLAQS